MLKQVLSVTDFLLVVLLLSVGVYFTLRTRFVQLRLLKNGLKELTHEKKSTAKTVSSFQSLMISTASRVGTGNIAGVATAIVLGGPGTVFWMWLICIIGSASAFVESTLAQIYKQKGTDSFIGGPAYYISKALKQKWVAVIFSISLILCFGIGFSILQSYNITSSLTAFNDASEFKIIIAVVLVLASAYAIIGGIHRIGILSSYLVPMMALIYIGLGLYVVFTNLGALPGVVTDIFTQAFTPEAAIGGGIGATILYGVKRGLFSNEAGMGSSPNAAATADVSHPVKQGLAQVISVFIDTLLICSTTAFIILLSPEATGEGINLVQSAFEHNFGKIGIYFITAAIILFAYTSIVGNYTYVESNFKFLVKNDKYKWVCQVMALVPVAVGVFVTSDLAWDAADLFMAIMAIINITAIFFLFKIVIKVLKDYTTQLKAGKDPVFKPKELGIKDAELWEEINQDK